MTNLDNGRPFTVVCLGGNCSLNSHSPPEVLKKCTGRAKRACAVCHRGNGEWFGPAIPTVDRRSFQMSHTHRNRKAERGKPPPSYMPNLEMLEGRTLPAPVITSIT